MQITNQNIDATVADVKIFFEKYGSARKDTLKICLIMEEILLRYQAHFGSAHEFDVYKKNLFGMPRVIIRIAGEPFYPPHYPNKNDIEPADAILNDEIMRRLFNYETTRMNYRYDGGFNEINFFSVKERKPQKIPGGSVTVAIILAIICSFVAGYLPQDVQNILVGDIVTPLLSSLMNLIVTVTVFMMFFSIVSSICAIENVTTLENIGTTVIGRFFLLDLLIIALTMTVGEIFFPVISIGGGGLLEVGKIVELLLEIIPTNILKAFSDANILQVTVIAFATGICVIITGNRGSNLKNFFIDLNAVIFKITELTFKVIPPVIFLCIFKTLSTNSFAEFFVVWKLIAANCTAYATILIVLLIWLSLKSKINIADFLRKISPPFFIALTTGSTVAPLPKNLEVAKNELHIEEKFGKFWFPLAMALFSPSVIILTVTAAFFVTAISDGTISLMQLLIVSFLAIQPRGSMVAIYSILLTQLELPLELLGTLMIAVVIINNIFTALKTVTYCVELVAVAQKLNFIKGD